MNFTTDYTAVVNNREKLYVKLYKASTDNLTKENAKDGLEIVNKYHPGTVWTLTQEKGLWRLWLWRLQETQNLEECEFKFWAITSSTNPRLKSVMKARRLQENLYQQATTKHKPITATIERVNGDSTYTLKTELWYELQTTEGIIRMNTSASKFGIDVTLERLTELQKTYHIQPNF